MNKLAIILILLLSVVQRDNGGGLDTAGINPVGVGMSGSRPTAQSPKGKQLAAEAGKPMVVARPPTPIKLTLAWDVWNMTNKIVVSNNTYQWQVQACTNLIHPAWQTMANVSSNRYSLLASNQWSFYRVGMVAR